MIYVSQIIMLYTLNLHSVVCQLQLNKTGRKKKSGSMTQNQNRKLTCFTTVYPLLVIFF